MTTSVFPPLRITDPAVFGRVAVLMGGTSTEREVSLDSGRNVLEALQSRGATGGARVHLHHREGGHWIHAESPGVVVELIDEWLPR